MLDAVLEVGQGLVGEDQPLSALYAHRDQAVDVVQENAGKGRLMPICRDCLSGLEESGIQSLVKTISAQEASTLAR